MILSAPLSWYFSPFPFVIAGKFYSQLISVILPQHTAERNSSSTKYRKRNCCNQHRPLWGISNIIRNTLGDFMWKCRWTFVGEKCEHFFRLNVCIGFRVSSTFGQSDGCMSDTPETMGGLSGVPNGTSSQTI